MSATASFDGAPDGAPPALDPSWRAQLAARLAGFAVQGLAANAPAAPGEATTPARRRAAVALTLVEAGLGAQVDGLPQHAEWRAAPALLLTKRALTLKNHAGQWALPGGRIDEGESPEQAALRELQEEVGLPLGPEAVLGRLDDYATRSGFVITPVVVWGGAVRELALNAAEVASAHRIPVAELLREDAPILNHVAGAAHPVLRMPIGQRWIAAPTAAFLYQFRELCLCGLPTRVAHFDQPHFAWR